MVCVSSMKAREGALTEAHFVGKTMRKETKRLYQTYWSVVFFSYINIQILFISLSSFFLLLTPKTVSERVEHCIWHAAPLQAHLFFLFVHFF
jgi:hypothetical protein